MTMRRQRCTKCNSVFYTRNPKATVCGTCAPVKETPKTKPKPATKATPKAAPQAATAAPDATE